MTSQTLSQFTGIGEIITATVKKTFQQELEIRLDHGTLANPADSRKQLERVDSLASPDTKAALPASQQKPVLDVVALRDQIISNALALRYMAYTGSPYPIRTADIQTPMIITGCCERARVKAAVVVLDWDDLSISYGIGHHQVMYTLLESVPASSDAEALSSLYEESKRVVTIQQARLEAEGGWVKMS